MHSPIRVDAKEPGTIAYAGRGLEVAARVIGALAAAGLSIYSAMLLWIEASTSQEYVRRYFTDIGRPAKSGYFAAPDGDTIFYAVNTSLSSFLLGCAGVLLIFGAIASRKAWSRQSALYSGQGVILLWMALDERYMLHERIGGALHIPSTVILASAVLFNGMLYIFLFKPSYFNMRMLRLLAIAGLLFSVMMTFDLFFPHDMPLRLAMEDLSKTWAGFTLLLFAWETARFSLIGQPQGEKSLRVPPYIASRVPFGGRSRLAS